MKTIPIPISAAKLIAEMKRRGKPRRTDKKGYIPINKTSGLHSGLALRPFLKWAGGKRWFVNSQGQVFPANYKRFIEPFLGSGAVFFHLKPASAVLSDVNPTLIETYQAIKDDWKKVLAKLRKHHNRHSKRYYYRVRDARYRTPSARAAQFIYLNRTCWNGLYRVNLLGKFNVPIGTKTQVLQEEDNFKLVAEALKSAKLLASDFEAVINQGRKGDLLFVDPPYTVKHNNNVFIKYNEKLFGWDDQVRLNAALLRAKKRGAKIILTNANHSSVRQLFSDLGKPVTTKRHSIIAASANDRKTCEEIVVRSF